MRCDVCGADPMTANCNNANCDLDGVEMEKSDE